MKILFTGGGTGGHVYPIVAVVRALKINSKGRYPLKLFYLGPKDNFCRVVLAREGVKVKTIAAGKIRRYMDPLAFFQNIIDMVFKVPLGTVQAFFSIMFMGPDLVFSKGGYGSFPVTFSAWMMGIPIFLQESDISPGLTSRQIASRTLEVFTSFPKTEFFSKKKMILVGNPIRTELLSGTKESALKSFSLKGDRPVILIIGGSLGAQRINDKILDALPQLLASYEIIHQVGAQNIEQIKKEARITASAEALAYYHPVGFSDEKILADAYAAADLIVSRAGGGSIFEIAASKKPCILIPLPEAAQNHQVKNAYAYAGTGAGLVLEENNFTLHLFLQKISDLLSSPQNLALMSKSAAEFARPKAAFMVAEYIANYLTS